MAELDRMIQAELEEAARISGFKILRWDGTKRRDINGLATIVTEYKRSSLLKVGKTFHVRLVRVLRRSRSFTLTVSYSEAEAPVMRPITDFVINSLRQD